MEPLVSSSSSVRSVEPVVGGEELRDQEAGLWEQVFSRGNLLVALKRVERNKGASGVDGLQAHELRQWCHEHWIETRKSLDAGTYAPLPVRQVMIPKPDGGQRMLGVPSVLDRLIQQALAQVLSPIFDAGVRAGVLWIPAGQERPSSRGRGSYGH